MKFFWASILLLLAAASLGAPSSRRQAAPACPSVSLNASTNIWKNYKLHPNPYYRDQAIRAAGVIQDATLMKKALLIADIGTFFWLCVHMPTHLKVLRLITHVNVSK